MSGAELIQPLAWKAGAGLPLPVALPPPRLAGLLPDAKRTAPRATPTNATAITRYTRRPTAPVSPRPSRRRRRERQRSPFVQISSGPRRGVVPRRPLGLAPRSVEHLTHLAGRGRVGRAVVAALLVVAVVPLASRSASAGPAAPARPAGASCAAGFPAYQRRAVAGSSRLLSNVALRMSDGVVLRADITLPVGPKGPFATALTINGYGKSSPIASLGGGSASGLVSHGYATMAIDDRGTGKLRGHLGLLGHPHDRGLRRGARLDRPPTVERRAHRHDRRVLHGDHLAARRVHGPRRGQGGVRHRADGRRLPRHRRGRRPDQHGLHPALDGAGHLARRHAERVRRSAAGAGRPPPRHHPVPATDGRRGADGWCAGLRRALLAATLTDRGGPEDHGADLHRRWARRHLPAGRAAPLRAPRRPHRRPPSDRPVDPHRGGHRAAPRRRARHRLAAPPVVRPARARPGRPRRVHPAGHPVRPRPRPLRVGTELARARPAGDPLEPAGHGRADHRGSRRRRGRPGPTSSCRSPAFARAAPHSGWSA